MSAFTHKIPLPRFATIEKAVGETPLNALERLRMNLHIPKEVPLAYAGRLDPMASGTLLILIGDECKVQSKYHALDKRYEVEVLLGISSDSGDVLGLVSPATKIMCTEDACRSALKKFVGAITLPYPHFSSKTVRGKPLHTWALEKRIEEIDIPKKDSTIYALNFISLRTIPSTELLTTIRTKIETIPEVIDARKALGANFRRTEIRDSWNALEEHAFESYAVLSFSCIATSGTYMRSLAESIANELGTGGLAYSINRTTIGKYVKIVGTYGVWRKRFRT